MRTIDLNNITDIEVDNIDMNDYPDFVDAFILSANWKDTLEPLTEEELDALNEDRYFVYECVWNHLY